MANHFKFHLLPKKPFEILKNRQKNNPDKAKLFKLLGEKFNLRHVDRVEFSFDPFHEHIKSIRDLIYYTSVTKIRATNEKCVVRTNITTDRSDPQIKLKLFDGKEIVYKTSNLSPYEVLNHWSNYTSKFDKAPEDVVVKRPKAPDYGPFYKKQPPPPVA